VNVKAPKEQSLTLEISMTRMRQGENNQGAKESAGSVSWKMERKNIVERIKERIKSKEEVALLGLLHNGKRKKGNKKSSHQRHQLVVLHGLLAKTRSHPSRLAYHGCLQKRNKHYLRAQQTEGRGGPLSMLNKYEETEVI
jgi:hypothetical protein